LATVISIITIVLYLASAALLLRRLLGTDGPAQTAERLSILALSAGAAVLHAATLFPTLWVAGGLNLAFNVAASMIALAIVTLYVLVAMLRPVENLGIVVLPLAAVGFALGWLWPGQHLIASQAARLLGFHLIISVLAYGLLSLAVVQALTLGWQEYQLRHRHPGRLLRFIPPIQTMEALLFQMIGAGFALLTLTLVTGVLFAEEMFGRPMVFSHHIVLSLVAWVVFAALLYGHWRFGWRGRTAVRWTLGGFVLLILAYFGSKFVLEVVLGR
jgi:ABC-type uncharacterized transport system permease subunit